MIITHHVILEFPTTIMNVFKLTILLFTELENNMIFSFHDLAPLFLGHGEGTVLFNAVKR